MSCCLILTISLLGRNLSPVHWGENLRSDKLSNLLRLRGLGGEARVWIKVCHFSLSHVTAQFPSCFSREKGGRKSCLTIFTAHFILGYISWCNVLPTLVLLQNPRIMCVRWRQFGSRGFRHASLGGEVGPVGQLCTTEGRGCACLSGRWKVVCLEVHTWDWVSTGSGRWQPRVYAAAAFQPGLCKDPRMGFGSDHCWGLRNRKGLVKNFTGVLNSRGREI